MTSDNPETPKERTWDTYTACAYAEGFNEGEDATEEERIEAFQYLINTGVVWTLQGWYGRTAQSLIDQGLCTEPEVKRVCG